MGLGWGGVQGGFLLEPRGGGGLVWRYVQMYGPVNICQNIGVPTPSFLHI